MDDLVLVEGIGIPKDFEKAVGARRAWRPVAMARKAKIRLVALKIGRRKVIV